MKEFYNKYKKQIWIAYGVLCVLAFIVSRLVGQPDNIETVAAERTSEITYGTISSEVFELSKDTVRSMGQNIVKDLHGAQNGKDVTLSIVVLSGTSKEKARELGDSFLRQVISNTTGMQNGVEEAALGKEIGRTRLNYRVIVGYGADAVISDGSKESHAENLSWHD